MRVPKLDDIQAHINACEAYRGRSAKLTKDRAELDAERTRLIEAGKGLGFEKSATRDMLDAPAEPVGETTPATPVADNAEKP